MIACRVWRSAFTLLGAVVLTAGTSVSQQATYTSEEKATSAKWEAPRSTTVQHLPINLLEDQLSIWTSPSRVRSRDMQWLVPLGLTIGISIATDRWVPRQIDSNPHTAYRFGQISNAGVFGIAAVAGGTYLAGRFQKKEHQRKAGFLAGQAMLNSLIVGETLKVGFGRERPFEGTGRGKFWNGGNSFPSDHSMLAWSAAAVMAHEYPGWASKLLIYGGATTVSLSRVLAEKHFPSDVIVGGALGYLIGRKVSSLHDSEGNNYAQYGSFATEERRDRNASSASVYVPMDSWIYPAFDRLIALGYVKSGIVGMRPWTRSECKRLLDEAEETGSIELTEPARIFETLQKEFGRAESLDDNDNVSAVLENVYTRVTAMSGQPLADDYNFGSTIVNDFGRPFQEGFNTVTGFSGRAKVGSLSFYARENFSMLRERPHCPTMLA